MQRCSHTNDYGFKIDNQNYFWVPATRNKVTERDNNVDISKITAKKKHDMKFYESNDKKGEQRF